MTDWALDRHKRLFVSPKHERLKATIILLPLSLFIFFSFMFSMAFITSAIITDEPYPAPLLVISGIFIVFIIAISFFSYSKIQNPLQQRMKKPRLRMLWLRKFDANDRDEFIHRHLVPNIHEYYIGSIFLTDSKSGELSANAGDRVMISLPAAAIFGAISSFLLVSYFSYHAIINEPNWVFIFVLLYFVLIVWSISFFAILLSAFVLSIFQKRPDDRIRDKQAISKSISRKIYRRPQFFRAKDDEWQDVVRLLSDRSDIVLFDITDISENMEWEIQYCSSEGSGIHVVYFLDSQDSPAKSIESIRKLQQLTGSSSAHLLVRHADGGLLGKPRDLRLMEAICEYLHRVANGIVEKQPLDQLIQALEADAEETPARNSGNRRRKRR